MFKNKILAVLFIIPAMYIASCLVNRSTSHNSVSVSSGSIAGSDTLAWPLVENEPVFHGRDSIETFDEYISRNLCYTTQDDVQGRVFLEFVIGVDGKVGCVKIIRGLHPSLDAEAIRVVSASPPWTPGISRGKPVAVKCLRAVTFKLW